MYRYYFDLNRCGKAIAITFLSKVIGPILDKLKIGGPGVTRTLDLPIMSRML